MSTEMLLEYDIKRLKYVRLWCLTQVLLFATLHIVSHFRGEYNQGSVLYKYFHWTLTGTALLGCYQSYRSKIQSIYWTILLIEFQSVIAFTH